MSSYDDLYSNDAGSITGDGKMAAAFGKEFPNLAQALEGCFDSRGKGMLIPPATVTFWWRDGHLSFCIAPKGHPKVLYGTIDDPMKGFWSIEDALQGRKVESKPNKRQKSS